MVMGQPPIRPVDPTCLPRVGPGVAVAGPLLAVLRLDRFQVAPQFLDAAHADIAGQPQRPGNRPRLRHADDMWGDLRGDVALAGVPACQMSCPCPPGLRAAGVCARSHFALPCYP
mgnify:CR=1 FL=1